MEIEIPELKPQSTNEAVAQASRCALRTYANHIKYNNPDRSREILEYVRHLDSRDEQEFTEFTELRKRNAEKRNNQYCSIVMGILSQVKAMGMEEYSVEDLKIFLKQSRKFKSILPFVSHTLMLLVDAKKIKIEEGMIQL